MVLTFFLKDSKAVKETPLFLRITLPGVPPFKYSLPERLHPKHWNQLKQTVRQTLAGYSDFNNLLKIRKEQTENTVRAYVAEHGNHPKSETLRELLNVAIKGKVQNEGTENEGAGHLAPYFARLIEKRANGTQLAPSGKPFSPASLSIYRTALRTLKGFEEYQKKSVLFADVDLTFYSDFTEWLTNVKGNATNTIGKNVKVIKTVMNEAVSDGVTDNLKFRGNRFKTVSEEADSIFLNEAELKALEGLDLAGNTRLERVRDLFLIGAYTGVRFSDWDKIRPENIGTDNLISIKAEKTGNPVSIPVHSMVKRIFNRYADLPRVPTNQKANDYLKELGQLLPALCKTVSKKITKGGLLVTANVPKWQLLTTHTARRSFATNMYKAGIPAMTIRAITGHLTEKAFLKYIKLDNADHAHIMAAAWANAGISSPQKVG